MTYDSTKYYANRGVERNKRPLKNKCYRVIVKPLSEFTIPPSKEDLERYEQYKFKDKGYLMLESWLEEKKPIVGFHGFITPGRLKAILGEKQWSKFCQGKREFIIQRRVNGRNIKKKNK